MFSIDLDAVTTRPLKRAEYDELVGLGRFENEKVELLNGVICAMMSPQKSRHASAVQELSHHLFTLVGTSMRIRVQLPFAASDLSEPEPDIAVVPAGLYADEHPKTAYLIIEVADTSLRQDRNVKAKIYAQAGVPEYWIVNLMDNIVEVHTEPLNGEYRRITPFRKGDRIELTVLKGHFIDVDAITS